MFGCSVKPIVQWNLKEVIILQFEVMLGSESEQLQLLTITWPANTVREGRNKAFYVQFMSLGKH